MVKEHFYLMSVLRNLVNNAIESCKGNGKVSVYAEEVNGQINLTVKDTGGGISDEDASFIYNTGYSTKFNKETGDINRGIGLTLVKDLIENIFKGSIEYESEIGVGTCFTVSLDKEILEGGGQ